MTANTILDRAFPVEPHIDQAIHDAALGQHEQDAMMAAAGITVGPNTLPNERNQFTETLYLVLRDGVLEAAFSTDAKARAFAYDLAGQLVADEAVGDLS